MALFSEHELTDTDPDSVENLGVSELYPEGYYRVKLDAAKQDESKVKGTAFVRLTFLFLEAPYKGKLVSEDLYLTLKDKAVARKILFADRLGLLSKFKNSATGKDEFRLAEGKTDFGDVIGAEAVIHVQIDANDKPSGDGRQYQPKNRLAFGGIYSIGDPKLPGLIAGLNSKAAGGKSAKQSAGNGSAETGEKYNDL